MLLVIAVSIGCKKTPPPPPPPPAEVPTEANEGIVPVYPKAAVDARATSVCEAMHALPAQRKGECCKAPASDASALVNTCVETLSGALATNDVKLDNADACINARKKQLEGCGWVGPLLPPLPQECNAMLTGVSAELARCRSSVECKEGLRCLGAGPLDAGRCAKPAPIGGRCGSVDALSVVIAQSIIDEKHPQCASGVCALGRCQAAKKTGEECRSSLECGVENHCDGTCVAGKIPVGGACKRSGCEDDAVCIEGKCAKQRLEGESCTRDFDCAQGACEKGKCGMRCTSWQNLQTPTP